MKRKFLILVLLVLTSFAFSKNFFEQRFVELRIDVPVTVGNNSLSVFDFLQKEVVIDLRQIADNMTTDGFTGIMQFSPNIGLNINLTNIFHIGAEVGVQGNGKMNISRGLFDFLGYGNGLYSQIHIAESFDADIFAYLNLAFDIKIKKFSIGLIPNLYVPLFHFQTEKSYAEINNDEDGRLSLDMEMIENIYSFMSLDEKDIFKSNDLQKKIMESFGLDLEGFVGWDFTDIFGVKLNYRVPIIPGRLYYCTPEIITMRFDTKVMDLIGSGIPGLDLNQKSGDYYKTIYYLNRPLKVNLDVRFNPLGNFIVLNVKGGVGVRNPFMPDMRLYPEYLAGLKISLANIISAQLKTDYLDELFKHTLAVTVNLRFLQVDLGLSLASTDFLKSFQGTGIGCFVTVSMGF